MSPILLFYMIQTSHIKDIVSNLVAGTELFIVDVIVNRGNRIIVLADSPKSISIDECANLSKAIETILDGEEENYELEVSSPGLLLPFKVIQQYNKYLGHKVEVLCNNGQKYAGVLLSVSTDLFSVEIERNIKTEGKKKPEKVIEQRQFKFDEVKSTKNVIDL